MSKVLLRIVHKQELTTAKRMELLYQELDDYLIEALDYIDEDEFPDLYRMTLIALDRLRESENYHTQTMY